MNEEFGDGIMSAIDMFATVTKIKGKGGEARCVVTLNGKVQPVAWQLHGFCEKGLLMFC